ncbi:YheC/YheD family protein [Aquisalibacillus elongatus]|uniref:YheC/D-like protein n=1 Tax=Aquisalibacillus elongatus TaxID=485577 RepID=A0A3N5B9G1_9BACI|nr:YheC/YheD family protein [Aquisalibacillus elongatus]RPF54366.1 YheC/D-like protein [Aquisalibacillus elongatus]
MANSNKELEQIVNISDTILEATEHFHQLIKDKDVPKSIYIFSSIVEGYTVIQQSINQNNHLYSLFNKYDQKIMSNIKNISELLEKQKHLKVNEIVQFSFLPLLKKWNKELHQQIGYKDFKTISIGVYNDKQNPLTSYSKERILALDKHAKKKGCPIFYFSSEDVDLSEETINAHYLENDEWKKGQFNYPDVIHNLFPKAITQQSRTERKLKRKIPFTSFIFGNKLYLPKKMVENNVYADLLVPFRVLKSKSLVFEFFKYFDKGVLKPISGARGEHIYFVTKRKDKFEISRNDKSRILNVHDFSDWLDQIIFNKQKQYMIQQYIDFRTKQGEPFDFRAHMQKNGEGKWQITKMYPRKGSTKSNQIQIYQDNNLLNLHEFLKDEFDESWKDILNKLEYLSLDLSFQIDTMHGFAIDEMGLDIAIDQNRRFWLHEANLGPQTKAHEYERAEVVIDYAMYLAENQIFHTNAYNERYFLKNFFDSRNSTLPIRKLDQKTIGIFTIKQHDEFTEALAEKSAQSGYHVYTFTHKDVDIDQMLIRGQLFENNDWHEVIVEYPDVIFNRVLNNQNNEIFNSIFEDFEHIPILNQYHPDFSDRKFLFNQLSSDLVVPYAVVNDAKSTIEFLKQNHNIVLKPVKLYKSRKNYISSTGNDEYDLTIKGKTEKVNSITLKYRLEDYFKEISEEEMALSNPNLNLKDEEPYEINVHLHKVSKNHKWDIVHNQTRFNNSKSEQNFVILTNNFVNQSDLTPEHINIIEKNALNIAQEFDSSINKYDINDVVIHFIVTEDLNIFVNDVRINNPELLFQEKLLADYVLQYINQLY